jgi:DNA-binding transcriptional MerR regulator
MTIIESRRKLPEEEFGLENLLSIGEVAKIRGINVQSLRYYEKIGVLTPVYINPESGYRYYSLDQLMILDTILLCIEIGIPLKDLRDYVDESGQLEFERLLCDGRRLAKEKMQRIENHIDSIDYTLGHIRSQRNYFGRRGYYTRYNLERYILTTPCELYVDANTYEETLSRLFSMARDYNLQASFPHGIIVTYRDGKCISSELFLEILPHTGNDTRVIEEGNYRCYQELREVHSNSETIFPEQLMVPGEVTAIISTMSPDVYKYDQVVLEFQVKI